MSPETLQTITWLIPAGPMLAFFLIALFTNKNRTLSWVVAWSGVIAALILSWTVVFYMVGTFLNDKAELDHHPVQIADAIDWIPVGPCVIDEGGNCLSWIDLGVAVDGLTSIMLFMVPLAVFMIFVYSVGYHNYGKPRGHATWCAQSWQRRSDVLAFLWLYEPFRRSDVDPRCHR